MATDQQAARLVEEQLKSRQAGVLITLPGHVSDLCGKGREA